MTALGSTFDADRPGGERPDELGYRQLGAKLAAAIVDHTGGGGLVIGIEGAWGSGKSTLFEWTCATIRTPSGSGPELVRFEPWLVGSRDAMLHDLFSDIARAAAAIAPRVDLPVMLSLFGRSVLLPPGLALHWLRRRQYRHAIRNALGAFVAHIGVLRTIAGATALSGHPAALAGKAALSAAEDAAKAIYKGPSLRKHKEEVSILLKGLSRPILVWIDDLDRLEPLEALEVLRLVRAVADFPNVIYVLTYDRPALSAALATSLGLKDGDSFLQKFVQVSFKMPVPESFALRRWFRQSLPAIFGSAMENLRDNADAVTRLASVIDHEGGLYLETPRDVVRTLNAVKLYFPASGQEVDLADLVWLQIIRQKTPLFYDWIEAYVRDQATIETFRHLAMSGHECLTRLDVLKAALGPAADFDGTMQRLSTVLSGIERTTEGNWKIHEKSTERRVHSKESAKRLRNPSRHRWYFAFAGDARSVTDTDLDAILAAAAVSGEEASTLFRFYIRGESSAGGSRMEPLLDLLQLWAQEAAADDPAAEGVLQALAETMDDASTSISPGDWGRPWVWVEGTRLLRTLLRRTDTRTEKLERMYRHGSAIGWLTDVFREETFSHGVFGERQTPPDEWLFSAAEFDTIRSILVDRYQSLPFDVMIGAPEFVSLLHGWAQVASYEDVRAWVETHAREDERFLALLGAMAVFKSGGDGTQLVLQEHNVHHFLDLKDARQRVRDIVADQSVPEITRSRAKTLLSAFPPASERTR